MPDEPIEYGEIQRLARTIAPVRAMLDAILDIAEKWKPLQNQIALSTQRKAALEKELDRGRADLKDLTQRLETRRREVESELGQLETRLTASRAEATATQESTRQTRARLAQETKDAEVERDRKVEAAHQDHAIAVKTLRESFAEIQAQLQEAVDAKRAELEHLNEEHQKFVERIALAGRR